MPTTDEGKQQFLREVEYLTKVLNSLSGVHPWDFTATNNKELGLEQICAVGLFPQGAAESGAMDMSGNIWEWTGSKSPDLDPEAGQDVESLGQKYIIRGGSWEDGPEFGSSTSQSNYLIHGFWYHLGFRVALS